MSFKSPYIIPSAVRSFSTCFGAIPSQSLKIGVAHALSSSLIEASKLDPNGMPQESAVDPSKDSSNVPTISMVKCGSTLLTPSLVEVNCNSGLRPVGPLIHGQEIIRSNGKAFAVVRGIGNPYILPVGGNALDLRLREHHYNNFGKKPSKFQLSEIVSDVLAYSEQLSVEVATFARVAKIQGGIVVDLGDDSYYQAKVTAGKVEIVKTGSDVLFYRPSLSKPMAKLAAPGTGSL